MAVKRSACHDRKRSFDSNKVSGNRVAFLSGWKLYLAFSLFHLRGAMEVSTDGSPGNRASRDWMCTDQFLRTPSDIWPQLYVWPFLHPAVSILRCWHSRRDSRIGLYESDPTLSPRLSDRIICMTPGETLSETRFFTRDIKHNSTKIDYQMISWFWSWSKFDWIEELTQIDQLNIV